MNQEEALKLARKRTGKVFLGEGSSRKVYEIDGFIIKKAKNKRGRIECSNESWLYTHIDEAHKKYLCPILYAEEGFVIMQKVEIIDFKTFETEIKSSKKSLIQFLFKQYGVDDFDLGCSFNWGILNGEPVIIDYGHNYYGEDLGKESF